MAKLNIDLKKLPALPRPVRIVIAVLPAIVFMAAYGYLGLLPKYKNIESLKQDIVKQQNEIVKSQSMVDRLDTLRAENAKLKLRLAQLEEHLPEEDEISSLLKQVSDLGIQAGLKILVWKPAPRRRHSSGVVYEIPVSVQLKGSYHRLGYFFASLANLERIVNVSDIKLSGPTPKGDEAILDVSFSAVTFTAIPEKPGAGGAEAKK
jgi:type IV pilus assembly protein PilO